MPLQAGSLARLRIQAWFDMDSDGRFDPAPPRDYSQLNDEQLRSAMRFAESGSAGSKKSTSS